MRLKTRVATGLLTLAAALGAQQVDYVRQVQRTPALDIRKYAFVRTNGLGASGDLSAAGASKSIVMTPCPIGVAGADASHYYYISGGTGTAEAVLGTGGTCTSGANSGTITVTTANPHTGAWSVSSASSGIYEAAKAAAATGYQSISLPSGETVQAYAPVVMTGGPLTVLGNGASIQCSLSVAVCVQLGSTELVAQRIWLRDLTVTRSAGSIPSGSIGVLWQWYSYCGQEHVRITRHARNIKLANNINPGQGSLGFESIDAQLDTATEAYLVGENAIGVHFQGGSFGINGGSADAPTYGMIVSGLSDTWMFDDVEMIPRGTPIPTALMSFQSYTGANGVFYFDHCNIERWNGLAVSDASTPTINEVKISDSRVALGNVNMFALNAATTLIGFQLSGSNVFARVNLSNPQWARVTDNFITSSSTGIAGGSVGSMVFSGNQVAAVYTFSGSWLNLSITGNNWIDTAPVFTATAAVNGAMQISGNTTNTGPHVPNTLGATAFRSGASLFGVSHAELGGYLPADGTLILCSNCQSSSTITPGSVCVSGGSGALAVRLNAGWRCY